MNTELNLLLMLKERRARQLSMREVGCLIDALEHAIAVIENYRLDIRDAEKYPTRLGMELLRQGFGHGSIYTHALADILRLALGTEAMIAAETGK